MYDKISKEMQEALEISLKVGVTDAGMAAIKKKVDDILYDIETDVMLRLKDDLAPHLAAHAAEMAGRAVDELLAGNEEQMRRYLGCEKRGEDGQYIGWTGRSDGKYFGRQREPHEWHPVIHGRLFEQGAVALRKKIVDAHRDLLVNERIIDLEDQVKSLVEQVNRANADKEAMWDRLRGAA